MKSRRGQKTLFENGPRRCEFEPINRFYKPTEKEYPLTVIFYFTGTGFSLHAARLIKSELVDEVALVPMVKFLAGGETNCTAEAVGFVMPMHGFGLPDICRQFLKVARFPKATYLFALVTRGGAPTNICSEIQKLLSHQKKRIHAFKYATTVNTFDVVSPFPTSTSVKIERERFEKDIREFAIAIREKEQSIELGYRNLPLEYFLFPLLRVIGRTTGYFNVGNSFYAEPNCTGCATCVSLCPAQRIRLNNEKPTWNHSIKCLHCLACIHRCLTQAIQIKNSQSKVQARRYCTHVSNNDISSQWSSPNS
jgi:ferredoxin